MKSRPAAWLCAVHFLVGKVLERPVWGGKRMTTVGAELMGAHLVHTEALTGSNVRFPARGRLPLLAPNSHSSSELAPA